MNRIPIVFCLARVATLGLMLVILFAPTAHAQQVTVEVNPGEPCNPASNFSFATESDAYVIDVLFKDDKTLEYGEGTHAIFFVAGAGEFLGYVYFGSLLDAAGDVLPETAFLGVFPSDGDPGGVPAILDLPQTTVFSGMRFFAITINEENEVEPGLPQSPFYNLSWVSSPPRVLLAGDPVTIGGSVTGLEGSGLVLQNNGADDLPIASDGPFTFSTSLQPCSTYNVTVLTNPTNPTQICSVENGSGDVPDVNVNDVAVTCVEPELSGIEKVATEGDTLADDTVLKDILLEGGVAINFTGQVAFGGRDGNDEDAVFTQGGRVVKEGDTLEDGTILAAFRGQGEVAISSGRSGPMVAFHGKAEAGRNDTDAVFTQAGKIAAEGDILDATTTLDDIEPNGKVAINDFAMVAFHGGVEIDSGLFKERPRAVIIANGQTTQVAAQEASNLPDETPLKSIIGSGGVAINDSYAVAFHGYTGNLRAVFTSDALVAKKGDILPDGKTLDYIDENGGVAIDFYGMVAFHGQTQGVKAVFIGDGETTQVVAKVGDTLPDGTTLDDIDLSAGVAINIFGDVTFHGRTGDTKAVLTQNGVVAKVGDILDDLTTLTDIWVDGGVAINPYGSEVAFHGQTGTTDAVLVGQAPVAPPPNNAPVAAFTFTTDNLTANFTDQSEDSDGTVVAWSWNFGDSSTSTEQNPSHTYAAAGTYTVSLTVTDDRNAESDEATASVAVDAP